MFTVRAMVLFVVVLLAFVLLFPTVRAYLAQKADNERLAQQVEQARAVNDDLAAELARWDDDAYVAAQARERLAFVLPGETAYRVVDPEVVPDPTVPAVPETGSGPAVVPEDTTTPWYATIWESVRVAGEAEVSPPGAGTGTP
ncbi:septum formation initiator family protein [Cellulomonas fimi]|uniref:Septum formation initiator family protein n=1 Tax=Cellulomonas fimi TaxID=1708 RepID=A0A7Y0QIX2_CELFI|nr:septum formation initiator family protein [Cellulomonas fimi]